MGEGFQVKGLGVEGQRSEQYAQRVRKRKEVDIWGDHQGHELVNLKMEQR